MTRITTADEARDYINTAIARTSWEEIHGLVVQWNNTTDNYIDANGDVWVEKPQTGRWLDNDSLVEFANFLAQKLMPSIPDWQREKA